MPQLIFPINTEAPNSDLLDGIDSTSFPKRIVFDIGDGTNTIINVTHNLNTYDCLVGLRDKSTPPNKVDCDVQYIDVNTVKLTFATAPVLNEYRVIIIG